MTEDFLMRAFELMGEKPEAIKVMRNKHTGLPAGFGFCQFRDEKQAMEILHKLNGKIIPYSQPVRPPPPLSPPRSTRMLTCPLFFLPMPPPTSRAASN